MKNYSISKKGTNIVLSINKHFTIETVSTIKLQMLQHTESTISLTVSLKSIESIDIAAAQLLVALQVYVKKNGGTIKFIQEQSQSVQAFLQSNGLSRYISLN